MAVDPSRLLTQLLNTGLQSKDNALYQVIKSLIDISVEQQKTINSFSSGSVISGPAGPQGPQGIPGIDGNDGEDAINYR